MLRARVLCTGNSCRSILAECLLNRHGTGRLEAFSSGSHPTGTVHPDALELLCASGYDTARLRSKSWDEFAVAGAPPMDFVFTVCDRAAGEACPIWPGRPIIAHWGAEDPAAFVGSADERRRCFRRVYAELEHRVRRFISLPLESLDRATLQTRVDEIGRDALISSPPNAHPFRG